MSFATFLQTLGTATHLDIPSAEQAGGCTIRFDERMEVIFEYDADRDAVQVFGTVLSVQGLPADTRARLAETLLQLHLFGLATAGSYFGFDPALGRVVLFSTLALSDGDAAAVAGVERFVNQLDRWQKGLLDHVSKTAPAGDTVPVMQRV